MKINQLNPYLFCTIAAICAFCILPTHNNIYGICEAAKDGAISNTFYVAPSGKDSYSGTEEQPFATIQKAADTVKAGSTVYIKQGTYYEQVNIRNSGAPDNYTTYKAYPGHKVIIDGKNNSGWHGLIDIRGANYIKVEDLIIRNNKTVAGKYTPGWGILIFHDQDALPTTHIEIRNVEIYNMGDTGIQIRGNANHILIEACHTHDVGFSGVDISRYKGTVRPHHVTVRNCVVHNCTFSGIGSEIADDLLIENNTIYDNPAMGIDIGSGARNKIYNNNISNCDTGIGLSSNIDSEVSYNIINNTKAEALYAYYWSRNSLPHARNKWHHNQIKGAARALYESCQKSDKYECGVSSDHQYYDNTFKNIGNGNSFYRYAFYFEKVFNIQFYNNHIELNPGHKALILDHYGDREPNADVHSNTIITSD